MDAKNVVRIFKAIVPPECQLEFMTRFQEISLPLVRSQAGLIYVEIGMSQPNADEFLMISKWKTMVDVMNFAGVSWNEPHIPKGMEKYIKASSVSHYYVINPVLMI